MSFLTIQKFTPSGHGPVRKIIIGVSLLVVFLIVAAAWVWFSFEATQAADGINQQIYYQGKIADSGGTAITDGVLYELSLSDQETEIKDSTEKDFSD